MPEITLEQINNWQKESSTDCEKILKKLDGISHQMFSYQLDILQFISELSEHMQNSDIEGIKQSSALSEIIDRVKFENKNISQIKSLIENEIKQQGQIDPYRGKNTVKYGIENKETVNVELVYNFDEPPKEISIFCKPTMALAQDEVFFKQDI